MQRLLKDIGLSVNTIYNVAIEETCEPETAMICFATPDLLLRIFPGYGEDTPKQKLIFNAGDLLSIETLQPGVYTGEIENSWEGHGFMLLVHDNQTCDYYCTYGGFDKYNVLTSSVVDWFELLRASCSGDIEAYRKLMIGENDMLYLEECKEMVRRARLKSFTLTYYPSLHINDFNIKNAKIMIKSWSDILSYPDCDDVWMGENEIPYNPTKDMKMVLTYLGLI